MGLYDFFFPPSLPVHVHVVAVYTTPSWDLDSARRTRTSEKSERLDRCLPSRQPHWLGDPLANYGLSALLTS